jgi:cyclopropane fatty-acyl-phospholipid synthase-like methyltransferase
LEVHAQSESLVATDVPSGLRPPLRVIRGWVRRKLQSLTDTVQFLEDFSDDTELNGDSAFGNGATQVRISNPAIYQRIALGGLSGAVSGYAEGMWHTDNLIQLIEELVQKPEVMRSIDAGLHRLTHPVSRVAVNFIPGMGRDSVTNGRISFGAMARYVSQLIEAGADDALSLTALRTFCESARSLGLLRLRNFDHVLVTNALASASSLKMAADFGATVTALVSSPEHQLRMREQIQVKHLEKLVVPRFGSMNRIKSKYSRVFTQQLATNNTEKFWQEYLVQLNRILTDDGIAVIETLCQSIPRTNSRIGELNGLGQVIEGEFEPPTIGELVSMLVDEHKFQVMFMEDFTENLVNAANDTRRLISINGPARIPNPPTSIDFRSWDIGIAAAIAHARTDRLRAVRFVLKR